MKLETKAKAFAGPECDAYREALQRARAAAAATVLAPAYSQLRELVRGFGRAYERLKADRSALDFEDLQLHARELLRSNERIRDRYREQFRHLMVDEFQDTNGLQLGLIEQLRGPDTRVFMVGDEFQSIYGFRHADVEVYRRQQRRFAGDEEPNGESMPLTGNFRAAPELLAATNALGAALLDGFEPLTAPGDEGARDGDPPVEMLLTVDDRKGWEDPDTQLPRLPDDPSSAPKVAEARRLAGRLRELVDAGQDPSEIVVLMRAFTHVNTLERSLSRAGLDPYVVGGRGFWSQQQIEDLRCLLAVVANPLDDEPLFGALASPACAVLPDTLWLLRRAATEEGEEGRDRRLHIWPLLRDLATEGEPSRGDPEAAALIGAEELERLSGFVGTLTELRRHGAEDGLESLVERVASAFDYDLATLVRDSGEARWANVRKLMRLAREFEAREGPDLTAFLDYLANRAARSDREAEAATRAEGHAGVRVMTVHSAKGLEFDVVAIADMGRNLQIGWTPLRLAPAEDEPDSGEVSRVGIQLGRLGRPGERLFDYYELADLAADREAEEEGRLAYVAATRARERLLLSGTFNPKALESEPRRRKPIANQLIRTLLEGKASERDVELPAAAEGYPAGRMRVQLSAPGPGAGAELLAERPAPEPAPAAMEDAPPLGRPRVAPAPAGALSYSALSDYEHCG
jgi:ATP-dependent exoDNAse (exonuclease V) beta subunit